MTRARRREMARMLGMYFDKIEAERKDLLMDSSNNELHVLMAGVLIANATDKLKQAIRYLDEPTPTHERKRK